MPYRLKIQDFDTGQGIAGAVVTILDYDGEPISEFISDATGAVFFDGAVNPEFLEPGHLIEIKADGYLTDTSTTDELARYSGYTFPLGKKRIFSTGMLLLMGAGAGLFAISSQKNKKVSGLDPKAITPYIIPLAAVGGVGFLVYKIGQKFGLFDDEEDKRRKDEAKEREEQYQASMGEICQATPTTKSEADWITIADELEHALDFAGYLQDYRDKAVYQLARAKNDCDVQKMIYYFGHRQLRGPWLIKSGDYTLSVGIQERLNDPDIKIVNDNYARKGIAFRW